MNEMKEQLADAFVQTMKHASLALNHFFRLLILLLSFGLHWTGDKLEVAELSLRKDTERLCRSEGE